MGGGLVVSSGAEVITTAPASRMSQFAATHAKKEKRTRTDEHALKACVTQVRQTKRQANKQTNRTDMVTARAKKKPHTWTFDLPSFGEVKIPVQIDRPHVVRPASIRVLHTTVRIGD